MENLRHHKNLIEEQATAIISRTQQDYIIQYHSDAQRIRDHLQRYDRDQQKFADTEKDRQEGQHSQVQAWFGSPDVETEHLDICVDREKYPKSGDWILEQETVKTWLSPDEAVNSILCINGNPGTGEFTQPGMLHIRDSDNLTRQNLPGLYYHRGMPTGKVMGNRLFLLQRQI